jgi:hypothetical protein
MYFRVVLGSSQIVDGNCARRINMAEDHRETYALSTFLFGGTKWYVRFCLLKCTNIIEFSKKISDLNGNDAVVVFAGKSIAGKRHLLTGAHNAVRDFIAKSKCKSVYRCFEKQQILLTVN